MLIWCSSSLLNQIHSWSIQVISGSLLTMSEHPPTLLIVYLRPDHEEETCYYIDKALTTAGITYRLIAQQNERVSLESATPFVMTHIEKRMVFALHSSLATRVVEDMALLVA